MSIIIDIAMTGEITLRGVVLPVGGVKEKVIAAHGSGIKKIILPLRNKKDLKDVPNHVKVKLFVEVLISKSNLILMYNQNIMLMAF